MGGELHRNASQIVDHIKKSHHRYADELPDGAWAVSVCSLRRIENVFARLRWDARIRGRGDIASVLSGRIHTPANGQRGRREKPW